MPVIQFNQVFACTVGTNKQSHRTQTARRCFEALGAWNMYKKFLKNGRSRGDDLLGFLIDLEYYLEDIEGVSNVVTKSTDDENNLLVASFTYGTQFSEDDIAKRIEQTWLEDLRYQEFEIHEAVVSHRKVVFHFCTVSSPIGVTGKIVANGT
jgi:hypothetical protein